MRITGGSLKGRRLNPPLKKWPTRPTTDFAKEALYNILTNKIDFEEVRFLDLYSGTGSHVYEFLSRGCTDITLVEKHRACIQFIKSSLDTFNIDSAQVTIHGGDVIKYIDNTSEKFDIIFADPPYALKSLSTLPDAIFNNELLDKEGMLIIEHDSNTSFSNHTRAIDQRTYGGCLFSFFE